MHAFLSAMVTDEEEMKALIERMLQEDDPFKASVYALSGKDARGFVSLLQKLFYSRLDSRPIVDHVFNKLVKQETATKDDKSPVTGMSQ